MRELVAWITRFVGSFANRRSERRLDDELAFHLEMQTRRTMERGLPHEAARRAAFQRLGGLDATKEAYRDQRGLPWLDTIGPDLRYGWRTMRRDLGFTAVALGTLAIGIGATTTIFSLLRGVLLAPLPYPDPERLVRVYESTPDTPTFPVTPYSLLFYRHEARTLSGIAGFTREDLQLAIDDRPERLQGLLVSSNYFDVLGVRPAIGRPFTWAEERANANVAIVSDAVWRSRFNADRAIVGRVVRLSGTPFTIVGVMPAGFEHVGGTYRSFPQGQTVDVWWPMPLDQAFGDRYSHYVNAVARLAPGVTPQQASSDLSAIRVRIKPTGESDWAARLIPLLQDVVGPSAEGIRLLMIAAGLVLLITCANVSSLLLSRATARRRERAVRFALGAGRSRLVRQSLTESLALTLPGAVCGAALAIGGVIVLRAILPQDFPRLHNVRVDRIVLAFSIVVACVSAAVFGLLPAWHEATDDTRSALHDASARSSASRRTTHMRNLLVVGETRARIGAARQRRAAGTELRDAAADGCRLHAVGRGHCIDLAAVSALQRRSDQGAVLRVAACRCAEVARRRGSRRRYRPAVDGIRREQRIHGRGTDRWRRLGAVSRGHARLLRGPTYTASERPAVRQSRSDGLGAGPGGEPGTREPVLPA
jgi:hypothetical protein